MHTMKIDSRNRPKIMAAVAVLIALAITFVVRSSISSLSGRFNQNAYSNMTTYAEQCASGIDEIKNCYSNLGLTLSSGENWEEDKTEMVTDMNTLIDHYEVNYLSFIGSDGRGVDYRGNEITRGIFRLMQRSCRTTEPCMIRTHTSGIPAIMSTAARSR